MSVLDQFTLLIELKQINTDNFKLWFGKSKVVDKNGNPLIVYHGTTKAFTTFGEPKYRQREQLSFGYHFSSEPELASKYASDIDVMRTKSGNGNVMPVYLKIENLLDVDCIVYETDPEWKLVTALVPKTFKHQTENKIKLIWFQNALDIKKPKEVERIIKSFGYDGIKYAARLSTTSGRKVSETISYIVFNKNQIKSAIGNNGNFDINSDNMNEDSNIDITKRVKILPKNTILYHGSDKKDIKSFYDNTFFTTNDYIANNYAENMDGYVYECINTTDLKCFNMQYNSDDMEYFINKYMGKKSAEIYKRMGLYIFSKLFVHNIDELNNLIKNLISMGFDAILFNDESFDKYIIDDTYIIFNGKNISINTVNKI